MSKLERKTQEAIHTLIRASSGCYVRDVSLNCNLGQRLAAQKGESEDIVGAMRAEEAHDRLDDDASDEED